jgi:hypothetical protein
MSFFNTIVTTIIFWQVEVGGPLMDFDGNFIGMNYYHAKETPFVPSFIVLKCLEQFKLFGSAFGCSCFNLKELSHAILVGKVLVQLCDVEIIHGLP